MCSCHMILFLFFSVIRPKMSFEECYTIFSDLMHILAFSLFMFKIELTVKTCKQEPSF